MKEKKGISEIVSYVLLVMIAIAISVLVYAFLKLYVPKEKSTCPEGISLTIESAVCDFAQRKLTLTLKNRGLFTVHKAFVRIGILNKKFRSNIPQSPFTLLTDGETGLQPQRYYRRTAGLPFISERGEYTLEIQPAICGDKECANKENLALCPTINQLIECK